MNWSLMAESIPALLYGAAVTVQLLLMTLAFGGLLALPLGIVAANGRPIFRLPVMGYITFFRGTPLLVQIFLVYYGLAQFQAVRSSLFWPVLREAWVCALLTLALHTAAYTANSGFPGQFAQANRIAHRWMFTDSVSRDSSDDNRWFVDIAPMLKDDSLRQTLGNLNLAYNPSSGTLDTRNDAEQSQNPSLYLCSLLTSIGQPDSVCDEIDEALKGKVIPGPGGGGGLPGLGSGNSGSRLAPPDTTLGQLLGGDR